MSAKIKIQFYIVTVWVLYILDGPDEIRFEPNPDIKKKQLIIIREGETIGPYQCIADCNPPCNITWKYMDANGNFYFLPQGRKMSKQHVNRTIKSYHCVAEWESQLGKERDFALDVKCKLKIHLCSNYLNKLTLSFIWFNDKVKILNIKRKRFIRVIKTQ